MGIPHFLYRPIPSWYRNDYPNYRTMMTRCHSGRNLSRITHCSSGSRTSMRNDFYLLFLKYYFSFHFSELFSTEAPPRLISELLDPQLESNPLTHFKFLF